MENVTNRLIKLFMWLMVLGLPLWTSAANIKLTGIVVEEGTNEPLIGASVLVKDTKLATVTNVNGAFMLNGVASDATLIVSYVGYKTQEVVVGNRTHIKIVLHQDKQLLDEVVVIGYGTMNKKELTSAISHVSSKDFLSVSATDPAMMIQGKVPGLSITNTGAADPNKTASLQIRGVSSRSAGLGPLIVIDGVPGGDLSNLNPNDIESFDVLKDGAASAIYGTRGSNGVILVTTKKGTKDGAVHTTYSTTLSWDKAIKELDMLTPDEYRRARLAWGDTGSDLRGNYDWFDGTTRTGFSQLHTLSLSGGNERTNYRVSVDYRDQNGIDLRSSREEYGGRASINHTSKGGLFNFVVNVAPRIVYRDGSNWAVFRNALEVNPTTPLMDPENPELYYNFKGQTAGFNPVELQKLEKNHTDTKFLDADATAKLNLLPLLWKGGDNSPYTLNTQVMFAEHVYDHDGSTSRPSTMTECINAGRMGEASRSYEKNRTRIFEWLANFGAHLGKNNVKAMVGYSYQYYMYSKLGASNKDFPNDGLTSDNLGSGEFAKDEGEVEMSSSRKSSKLISFFGRVSYDWDGKYLFTASLRHEGSSKFGPNSKWGNFPAASVGWRISNEQFMQGAKSWIDELKIRADYGVTGNQDFDPYKSLSTMSGFGYYLHEGEFIQVWGPGKNVNPDLHWEKGYNWNIGIDFSMFNNRFSGSLNYFNRRSKDLLGDYNVSLPPYLIETTYVNVGTMTNQGFEIDLQFTPVQTRDFTYNFNVVGTTMKNKFVDFSNSQYVGQDFYNVAYTENPYPSYALQRIEKGESIGNFYMWRYAGISEDGEWLVYNKNNEIIQASTVSDEDRCKVGNGLPKFTMSTTQNFRYKNFDLSLFFRGAFGFDIFNIHDFYYGTRKFNGNVLKKAYGKNFDISPTASHAATDYFLERGDYFKLEQLSIGYTLNIPSCRFLDKVRVYGTMNNVFTLTRFSGIDPSKYNVNGLTPGANGSREYYPSTRQFILGAQIDF